MEMLRYDEEALARDLVRVGIKSRIAFAASCAERLFPAYENFCRRAGRGDVDSLARALERVWSHLLGDEMSSGQVATELSRCMALIPSESDEPWLDERAYADDSASAIAYTLRTVQHGEPQEAAWAARRAYEAVDHYVMHRLGVASERQVLGHPTVQRELSRQRRDLEELLRVQDAAGELFVRLRARARAEGVTLFASSS